MASSQGAVASPKGPTLMERSEVPDYLRQYGYMALSACEWYQATTSPELHLAVAGHVKAHGHTVYNVECSLAKAGEWHSPFLQWRSQRRLSELREGLHDPVKVGLMGGYVAHFSQAPFAAKGHLPGTTSRLDLWCKRLAMVLNQRQAQPYLMAQALRLLEAPDMADLSNNPFNADVFEVDPGVLEATEQDEEEALEAVAAAAEAMGEPLGDSESAGGASPTIGSEGSEDGPAGPATPAADGAAAPNGL